jgi:sigma-B regulation protein RsbU (phosphoserine phosphatase)
VSPSTTLAGEIESMTETDRNSAERLALLCHLSQAFNSTLDLDEVLNRVMDEVIALLHAERGFVMLHPSDEQLDFRAARGIDQTTIQEPQFQVSRSIIARVAWEGRPLLTSDAQQDERLNLRRSVTLLGLRSVLCVPLKTRGRIIGVIYVDSRIRAGMFTPDDLDLLAAVAATAATAIENARLYQVAVERGRLEQELQMAREVQASLLPRETPQVPGWEFATRWQPARQVAGDYYDFIPLPGPQPGTGPRLGLVIADVSDKGMPAALFMAMTRSTVRAGVVHTTSPAAGIALANRLICADASGGMFVTLFYADLDLATGELTYVNAGHNPPLLLHAGRDRLLELGRTGMALGVKADASFEQHTVRLDAGDWVYLYTDGVTEAIDERDRGFGVQHLRQVLLQARGAPVTDVVASIERSLRLHVGDLAPLDDITMVVVKRRQGDLA